MSRQDGDAMVYASLLRPMAGRGIHTISAKRTCVSPMKRKTPALGSGRAFCESGGGLGHCRQRGDHFRF